MNNFLKLINVLLAALKPEDKEKYEKIQLDAETIFKVKSRYDHLFGKDDRVYIEGVDVNLKHNLFSTSTNKTVVRSVEP